MRSDVAEKVLRLRDALETVESIGSLSASTLNNATYLIDVLNDASCGGAVKLTPALIVVSLSGGTMVRLSWRYSVVVA